MIRGPVEAMAEDRKRFRLGKPLMIANKAPEDKGGRRGWLFRRGLDCGGQQCRSGQRAQASIPAMPSCSRLVLWNIKGSFGRGMQENLTVRETKWNVYRI
jgi:hypothetical protein